MSAPKPNLIVRSLLLNTVLPATLTAVLAYVLHCPWLWAWLPLVNAWLFALMLKDKSAARRSPASPPSRPNRTPEATLLWLTLLGATPAMILSRALLRHKTRKESFVYTLYTVLALQLGLILWFRQALIALLLG